MDNSYTICFYGSSDNHELQNSLITKFDKEIEHIIDKVLSLKSDNLKIITGGYGGTMDFIATKIQEKKSTYSDKTIEIIGITCDGYEFENANNDNFNTSNDYSKHNDVIIQAKNFSDRKHTMIELSDLFIVLPGKQGTLSELLLTCEFYEFDALEDYNLSGKKARILVHDYWKPLLTNELFYNETNISYFRNFNSNTIQYFNSWDFEIILQSLNLQQENVSKLTHNEFSAVNSINEKENYIKSKFILLKEDISKTILGRLYDQLGLNYYHSKTFSDVLRITQDTPILGLDFGWFFTSNKNPKSGNYLTFSTEKYLELTNGFFKENNSLMLNDYENEFKSEFLNGKYQVDNILLYKEKESIPKKEEFKKKGSFEVLKKYFETNQYGQMLIWKGFKVTQSSFVKKHNDENGNEIIFSVFLLLNHRIPKRKEEKIRQIIDDFILSVSSTKSAELFQEKEKEIIKQATHSAISQVMARNTSHNIGAHVMNKLIGDLSKIDLDNFKNYTGGLELYKGEHDKNKKLLDQISIFNNYVKCRMDYLADISFGTPMMQTNKYAYGDLFTEFDKVRLLLEHISGLDKFEFQIKFTRNGKEFNKEGKSTGADDLLLAIPNDILGVQAFYNILENIIRNTAKHANKKKDKTIFTVNFIDDIQGVSGYCKKKNCDRPNCKNTDCKKAHKKEIEHILKEFIAVEIYNNIQDRKIKNLVFDVNSKLNEDILDHNKLRSHSLGLVEMDASAAYLRKLSVENINDSCYDLQHDESWSKNTELNGNNLNLRETNCQYILKAIKKKTVFNEKKKENCFGYRFFLHRPAVVLVVTNKQIDETQKDKLQKEGIWIIVPNDFQKQLKDGKVFPHEFVVVDENITFEAVNVEIPEKSCQKDEKTEIEFFEYYKTSLPIRILQIKDKKILNCLFEKELEDWENFCWENWVKKDIPIFGGYNNGYKDPQAVFLDHLYSKGIENNSQQMWNDSLKAFHLEALSSIAQLKLPDFNNHTKLTNANDKLQKYIETITSPRTEKISGNNVQIRKNEYKKIIEAVQNKIIVIDERIQNTTKDLNEGGREFMTISYKDLYAKMGVIVPDIKNINLSEKSFEKIKIKVEEYIDNVINNAKSTDFILIHYSILERMFEKIEIKEKLDKWAENINVVITSGRGIPNNLSEKVRFVNLSSVITAFVDVRSKYAINYLLNSSRKSNII